MKINTQVGRDKYPTLRKIIFSISLFVLGIAVGFFTNVATKTSEVNENASELRLGVDGLTNPLLECEIGGDTIASRKLDFTPQLINFVDTLKESKSIENVGVYFRDLNNGPIVGINQGASFAPASLLKVPVLIAYLHWAEKTPSVLDEKIVFSAPVNVGYQQQFAPMVPLEVGKTYSAKELLETMIKYSDNQALVLLFKRLPKEYQDDLYQLLGVDPKLITDPTATLTVRQYSIFFRILFNASFLSRAHYEYALDLLTQTSFTDGLRAGVPAKVLVSHKFGERKIGDDVQQFHDCGIVYYPKHPYLLCVMTRGNNVPDLVESIQKVSDFVYQTIDKQYKE